VNFTGNSTAQNARRSVDAYNSYQMQAKELEHWIVILKTGVLRKCYVVEAASERAACTKVESKYRLEWAAADHVETYAVTGTA